jgi:FAD/FMN-containing dehydrogenase
VARLPAPLAKAWPVYLLLETDDLPELPDGVDAAVDSRLREYRERHTEAIATRGVPHKLDVAVPVSRIPELASGVEAAVLEATPPGRTYEVYLFGHLATGNLHVNVVGPAPDDEATDEAVLRVAAGLGGSIAAEHGVGVAKAQWLHLTRSAAEIDVMRRVKTAFDPTGLLNPGVLLPLVAGE